MIRKGWSWTALAAGLIGIVAALVATVMHYNILNKGFEGPSFCSISAAFDCDTVMASSYSSIWGIPVAGLALIYYLVVVLYVGFANWLEGGGQARLAFATVLSIPALIITAVMAYISLQVLETICLVCAAFYAVNLVLCVALPASIGVRLGQIPKFVVTYFRVARWHTPELPYRPAIMRHSLVAAALFGLGSLLFFSMSRAATRGIKPEQIDRFIQFHMAQPEAVMDLSDRPTWGATGNAAKVTIVEFSDFQCPFCRKAAFLLRSYLGQYRRQVQFVFVNYPLHRDCNPQVQSAVHSFACDAARTALCAAEQNRFWPLHDLIFERQKKISPEALKAWAAQAGLDMEKLTACLAAPQTADRLAADVALGSQLQVSGTPTVYVNGRKFAAWPEPRALRAVIEAELAKPRYNSLDKVRPPS